MTMEEIKNMDEQTKQFLKWLIDLPEPYHMRFCIAACDPEPEYQNMMQTITKEGDRQWLMRIREIFADAREKEAKKASSAPTDQSEAPNAHTTSKTGCQVHCTTKTEKAQEVGA